MDFTQLPTGFGMALAMNPNALNAYAAMTPEQQRAILDQARSADSQAGMHRIIASLAHQSPE